MCYCGCSRLCSAILVVAADRWLINIHAFSKPLCLSRSAAEFDAKNRQKCSAIGCVQTPAHQAHQKFMKCVQKRQNDKRMRFCCDTFQREDTLSKFLKRNGTECWVIFLCQRQKDACVCVHEEAVPTMAGHFYGMNFVSHWASAVLLLEWTIWRLIKVHGGVLNVRYVNVYIGRASVSI